MDSAGFSIDLSLVAIHSVLYVSMICLYMIPVIVALLLKLSFQSQLNSIDCLKNATQ